MSVLNAAAGGSVDALALAEHGPVIPVIVLAEYEAAVPMARALFEGGMRVLEITLRTPVALRAIEAIARAVPEAIVGAGTVRSAADVQARSRRGRRFVVSPGYSRACRPPAASSASRCCPAWRRRAR